MNKTTFFAYARRAPFGGRLSQAQVDGTSAILAEAERRGLPDEQTTYVLATAFHETGGKMQPVAENLNYTTAAQIKKTWPSRFSTVAAAQSYVRNPQGLANKVHGGRMGNTGANDGWLYRGRGLVQITGRDNYKKYGLGDAPDKALEDDTAVRILFDGMINGKFTGERLADYFGAGNSDPVGARAIVNDSDKAIVLALNAITRRGDEDYLVYVKRACSNPIARPVKIADLRDNLRAYGDDEEHRVRYTAALEMIGEAP
ncbi:hypothetical protein [Brucella tritici]|uniref:hypothetical protein n=1 Tax=Brucella tritici TaxID=94626 RepID=UPI003D6CF10E